MRKIIRKYMEALLWMIINRLLLLQMRFYSSMKIEANSLSLEEVRDVINGKTVLDEQKEIQEVKNTYAAYEKISEIDPYSIRNFYGASCTISSTVNAIAV